MIRWQIDLAKLWGKVTENEKPSKSKAGGSDILLGFVWTCPPDLCPHCCWYTEPVPSDLPVQRWKCWWVSWAHCWRCWTRRTLAPPPKRKRPLCGTSCSRYSLQVRDATNSHWICWYMSCFNSKFLHIKNKQTTLTIWCSYWHSLLWNYCSRLLFKDYVLTAINVLLYIKCVCLFLLSSFRNRLHLHELSSVQKWHQLCRVPLWDIWWV